MITSEGMVTLQPEETGMEREREKTNESDCKWKLSTAGQRCVMDASHYSMKDVIFRYICLRYHKPSGALCKFVNATQKVRSNLYTNM